MWELDQIEGWAPKTWCFRTVVLEKTLESSLDSKEIKPVNLKRNQPWIFIGRTVAEAESPILWPPNAKSWLIGKDPDAGKDWRQKEKDAAEDELVRWHHQLNGHEFEQTDIVKDRRTWCAPAHEVSKIQAQLSDWTTTTMMNYVFFLENITCSIPTSATNFCMTWNKASVMDGAQRLKHLPTMRETGFDPWVGKIPWRRKWQPASVLLPGESHRRRSLVGYSSWGRKESVTAERLHFHFTLRTGCTCSSHSYDEGLSRQCGYIWTKEVIKAKWGGQSGEIPKSSVALPTHKYAWEKKAWEHMAQRLQLGRRISTEMWFASTLITDL